MDVHQEQLFQAMIILKKRLILAKPDALVTAPSTAALNALKKKKY